MPMPHHQPLHSGGSLYSWQGGVQKAVFLHGWEGNYLQFMPIMESLYERGWSVFSLAAPGHKGARPGESHPIKFWDSLNEVAERIGDIDLLVGHSMGAGIASLHSAANKSPSKLVLIAPPSSFQNVLLRFCRFIGLPESHQHTFINYVSQYVNRPVKELDLIATGPHVRSETLIIHDHGDKEIPYNEGLAVARAIPDATCLDTTGLGHKRLLKDNAVRAKILEFAER